MAAVAPGNAAADLHLEVAGADDDLHLANGAGAPPPARASAYGDAPALVAGSAPRGADTAAATRGDSRLTRHQLAMAATLINDAELGRVSFYYDDEAALRRYVQLCVSLEPPWFDTYSRLGYELMMIRYQRYQSWWATGLLYFCVVLLLALAFFEKPNGSLGLLAPLVRT